MENVISDLQITRFESALQSLSTARELIEQASQNKDLRKLIEIKVSMQAAALAARNAEGLLLTSKETREIVFKAQELQLRTERAVGFIIPEKFPRGGSAGNQYKEVARSQIATLADFGLTKSDSSRAQKLSKIPPAKFEEFLERADRKTRHALLFAAREIENEAARENPEPQILNADLTFKIKNCDFRECGLPDSSINLISTDPPYGKDFLSSWAELGKVAERVLKPGGYFISYCGHSYLPQILHDLSLNLQYHWMIALRLGATEKTPVLGKDVFSMWKPVLVFYKPPLSKKHFIDLLDCGEKQKENHAWGQSVDESISLIETFSGLGDTVFDPCLGGGTTLEACSATRRNFIGCEINPTTFRQLEKRFPEAVSE